jgi:hypothetical protein
MKYHDMIIEASDAVVERTPDKGRQGQFRVRVVQSPDGWMNEPVPVKYDDKALQISLGQLDHRKLDRAGLIALGRTLAMLILPPRREGQAKGVRDYLVNSLLAIGTDAGLRLRLRLPRPLQGLPWEYMYAERSNDDAGMYGFLSLDPRVILIRHEKQGMPLQPAALRGDIKVLVAMASGEGLPTLDLGREKAILEKALAGRAGIKPVYLEDATLGEILAASQGSSVFYFAGHGMFERQMGDVPGTYSGRGQLALYDEAVDGETLGTNLLGSGVRLAVLGGCDTGRRDAISVWSGIAPALIKAQIPAVVANQFSISDKCAIAFSQQFYSALVGGLPIELAISLGRKAAFNADKEGRDWGVPVLYLQAEDGALFVGAADVEVRWKAREAAEADVSVTVREVAAGGTVIGGDVGQMLSGKLNIDVTVSETVYGSVTGLTMKKLGGGNVAVDMDVDRVETGGEVVGLRLDEL